MMEALIGIGGAPDYSGSWQQMATTGGPVLKTAISAAGIGDKVYTFGGQVGGTYYRDLRYFDVTNGTWTTLGNGTMVVRHNAVMVAMGGKLYVHGGNNSTGGLNDVWMYDPDLATWTQKLAGTIRHTAAAAAVGNKMYVCAGWLSNYLADLKVYDADANTWQTLSPLPGAARSDHTMASVGTKLYLYGGGNAGGQLSDHWCYDTLTDTWTQLADGPPARFRHTAVTIDDKIYVFSGKPVGVNSNELWCYDPTDDSWTLMRTIPTSGRADHYAGVGAGKMITGMGNGVLDCWQYTP
jgi:N-acetylneuraminic acid mutarotase